MKHKMSYEQKVKELDSNNGNISFVVWFISLVLFVIFRAELFFAVKSIVTDIANSISIVEVSSAISLGIVVFVPLILGFSLNGFLSYRLERSIKNRRVKYETK